MENNYKNIVIPVDLAHESSWRDSLPIAIDHALRHGACLHVITVVPNADIPAIALHLPDGIDRHLREEGREALKRLVKQEVPAEVNVEVQVGQGRIYREILRLAKAARADLIVMASHRPELSDYLIGANAAHVTRHAWCSVLVVREPVRNLEERIAS